MEEKIHYDRSKSLINLGIKFSPRTSWEINK